MGNGVCRRKDICECDQGYTGSQCEIPIYFGVNTTHLQKGLLKNTCYLTG
jgi:hypothetical protein